MSQPASSDRSKQPILVPVDFEPAARAALIFGARLAACSGAPLKILHVVHEPGDRPNYYQRGGVRDAILPMEVLAEALFRDFQQDVHRRNPELQVLQAPDTLLVKGLPSTRIPEVAGVVHASLIAMGHNRDQGILGNLFSSLSERVAHRCSMPVTVVYSNGEFEHVKAVPHNVCSPVDPGIPLGA